MTKRRVDGHRWNEYRANVRRHLLDMARMGKSVPGLVETAHLASLNLDYLTEIWEGEVRYLKRRIEELEEGQPPSAR